MGYQYDDQHFNPPAPVITVTIHIPNNSIKRMTIEALVDTGADITCIPKSFVKALGAECASSYNVQGVNKEFIGSFDSYFIEIEIATIRKMVEVIGCGDEPILGRNIINEFTLHLYGPSQNLDITFETNIS